MDLVPNTVTNSGVKEGLRDRSGGQAVWTWFHTGASDYIKTGQSLNHNVTDLLKKILSVVSVTAGVTGLTGK